MNIRRGLAAIAVLIGFMWPAAVNAQEKDGEPLDVFQDKGYLVLESEDGANRYWIDGRIMIDGGIISSSDSELANGVETRRARIAFKTILHNDWAGELDIYFADNEIEIKDFWLAYVGVENVMFKAGNHKVQNSLDDLTTSRWLTFMERGLPNVFTIGRRMGFSASTWGDKWSLVGGIFGEEPGAEADPGEQLGWGYAARATVAPVLDDDNVVHFGVSYSRFTPEAGDDMEVRFRQRPEVHFTERMLSTGKVSDVDNFTFLGFEGAVRYGSFSAQGEYVMDTMHRMNGEVDADFSGWYGFVSWFLTGDQRTYNPREGEFGPIYPKGKNGAFELAVRYSHLDLTDSDADVFGGEGKNLTFGANWYANNNVRIMANFIIVDNDEFADADEDLLGDDDFSIIAIRLQYLF
jgi:phosphate-selective porin OprO/OprP